jgi:hypothetical protein
MAFDARFEGRRLPKFERFRRLHIVMTVDKEVGAASPAR